LNWLIGLNNKAVIDSNIDDITGPGKVFTRYYIK